MLSTSEKAVPTEFEAEHAASEDAFIPFQPTAMREVPKESVQQTWVRGDAAFKIKSSFWESLLQDAWIVKELERVVQSRVEERCRLEAGVAAGVAAEKGKKEGFEKGFAEGETLAKQKVTAEFEALKVKYSKAQEMLLNRMNELSFQVVKEKKTILEQHSKSWGLALVDLIQKMPMAAVVGWEIKLNRWLESRLESFKNVAKVNVCFSAEEYEALAGAGSDLSKYPWGLLKDEALKAGEVRVECGDGGVFFSKAEYLEKIMKILTEPDQEVELLK